MKARATWQQPHSRLVVELHPGPDLHAYVDGDAGQVPILCIGTNVYELLVTPYGPSVTAADVFVAARLIDALTLYRDKLCGLVER